MGQEILEILNQFGAGGGGDPGNNAVRFLLAAYFWATLCWVSGQQYRRTNEKRDLYINLAAAVGLSRELVMFFLEYGTYQGFFPAVFSFRVFPPLEHALTDIGRSLLGFAYLRYFLPDKRIGNYIGGIGTAVFAVLYLITAPLWVGFLDAHPDLVASQTARFGLFWGDMAFRVSAVILLAAVLLALAFAKKENKRISFFIFAAFLCLFLDEFLMIINLATGDEPYRAILGPIRHNLGIWAIPMLLAGYWLELFEQLRNEKAKTEGILEAIGDGIVIEDMGHRILYQNPSHRALFGEKTGLTCSVSIASPETCCPLEAAAQSSGNAQLRKRVETGKGPVELEISSFPLRDGAGGQVAGISVVRDVTERSRMENALRESEERYRTLVEHIDLGVTLIDDQHRVLMANKTIGRTFARNPNDLVGLNCYREFERREEVCPHCPGVRAMATGKAISEEVDNVGADGKPLTVRIQAFPVKDAEGASRAFIEVVENITEQKRGRTEREQLEAKLMQNQKLESLGILAGGIAHDFNNLLMGIVGNVDLALAKSTPESPTRPYLQRIDIAAQRAADLTNQMLAYSGKGRFVIEHIHLSRLVEEMGHLLETVVSKRAIIKYNLAAELPPVEADATQLRQVVMNLITNASDAIGQRSGVITITTGLLEAERSYLNTTHLDEALPEGFYVYLEVADTGCGMDRETQAKIFDPFFTTKYTGRGLGLAAVLGIVKGHHGDLKVYSEPGRGTTFKILLPVAEHTAPLDMRDEKTVVGESSPKAGKGKTLLLIDDDETVRSVGKMMLEESGYQVLTAADGEEGVAVFRARADDISLVLLDLIMPHMDGDEAFRQMRTFRPDIPVVMSSGYNEQDTVSRFIGKGIAGFIQKPYRINTLLAKIQEVLGER